MRELPITSAMVPRRRGTAVPMRVFAVVLVSLAGAPAAWAQGGAEAAATPMSEGHPGERPIHVAARGGDRAAVQRLLAADASQRDVRTVAGMTPLHHAALNVDSGPLAALLAAGANPNARDAEGRTPLHLAAFATRTQHARLLLQAGADPHAKTDAGRDVLSLARKVRADETAGVISLWILKGCKPERPC